MKNEKGLITRVIKGINEKIPEGKDVFGYSGISKELLVRALEENYSMLEEIEKHPETFDVIVLKRNLADLLKNATEYLNKHVETQEKGDRFNAFIETLSGIRHKIKETYFLTVQECIRIESDVISAKSSYDAIKPVLEDLVATKTELEAEMNTAKAHIKEISKLHSDVAGSDQVIQELLEDSKADNSAIKTISTQVVTWEKEVNDGTVEHANFIKQWKTSVSELNESLAKANGLLTKTDAISKSLGTHIQTNEQLQADIKNIIDDANRSSMAGSFKKRKDELEQPIKSAERLLLISLLSLTLLSVFLLLPEYLGGQPKLEALLVRIPILFPLVWLAWTNSKKLGHMNRVREDYAFKYASAMAFEGYKKNVEESDELKELLLKLSIENMGANPIRLYEEAIHGTPFSEMAGSVHGIAKTLTKKKE